MRVVFIFSGLPHYLVKLLNKINSGNDIEVIVIIPKNKSTTLGSGVHESFDGIEFKVIHLEETKQWYGKPFFKDFKKVLIEEKPSAIISGWPYFLTYIFSPALLFYIKRNKIQLIAREIPFTVPGYHEIFSDFEKRCVESQKSEAIFKSKLAFLNLKLLRKVLYTFIIDKSLLYTEQGVDIIHSYGLKRERITTTYNSPDTEDILQTILSVNQNFHELKRKKYRLIHVGRLVKWKNVDLIIKAVNLLKNDFPEIELVIIGKGEEEKALKSLVNDLNLDAYVSFKGAIYEGEAQSIEFLQSGIYVLAGMGGLSINEAMIHGLPIICSVADGTEKHLVFDEKNGAYFKDNDLNSLAEAIKKVFHADMIAMGSYSKAIILDKINIKTVTKAFIEGIKS
ncbi:MAG: glycosyltransferase family 4 protein [Bacteroidota bacterium]